MERKDTRQRIELLENQFREAYILALETQANCLKGDFEQCTFKELIDTKNFRKKMSLDFCDRATEYMFLKNTDSEPEYFNEYMKLTESFMNKLEAELACRKYFNGE